MTASIPGTFRSRPPAPVRALSADARRLEARFIANGALVAELWEIGECSVIVGRERYRGTYRWHVSIAHPSRYPTWDEVKTAAYGIPSVRLPEGHAFAQLLGNPRATAAGWVDVHENCFHLYEVEDPLDEGHG